MKNIDIIFDLDNTLVSVKDFDIPNLIKTYAEFGITATEEELNKSPNNRIEDQIEDSEFWGVFNKYGTLAEREKAIKEKKIFLFDYAVETLEELAKYANLYIVSDTPIDEGELEMDAFDLKRYFKAYSFLDIAKFNLVKPNPYRGKKVLQGRRRDSELWEVGDSPCDILQAKALGAKSIFLTTGTDGQNTSADYICATLRQVRYIIRRESNVYLL